MIHDMLIAQTAGGNAEIMINNNSGVTKIGPSLIGPSFFSSKNSENSLEDQLVKPSTE